MTKDTRGHWLTTQRMMRDEEVKGREVHVYTHHCTVVMMSKFWYSV